MNNDNTANTWDNRRQNLNHWWEIADNKNDATWNTIYTPPETQQAAKQWLEHSSSIKSVIDGKCKTQPTNIKPWKKFLVSGKKNVLMCIACNSYNIICYIVKWRPAMDVRIVTGVQTRVEKTDSLNM